MNLPIVFVHFGDAWYLKPVLKQALKFHNTVYLITDIKKSFEGVEVIDHKTCMDGVQEFTDVYKHMSTNAKWVEHICIIRWKMMLNLLKQKNHDCAIYLDSDVLIFKNLNDDIAARLEGAPIGFSIPKNQPEYRWSCSAHTSYMTTAELEKLWNFMKTQYIDKESRKRLKRKHAYHIKNNKPGGVCDMTLLYLYAQENNVNNMTSVFNDSTYDHNINVSENMEVDEYEMSKIDIGLNRSIEVKNYSIVDGIPHVNNVIKNKVVAFNSLHFQSASGTKELIRKIV